MSATAIILLELLAYLLAVLYLGYRGWKARGPGLAEFFVAFLIALRPVPLIIQLSILSFAGTLQLAPAYLGALVWPRATREGAIASVLVGVTTLALGQWVLPTAWLFGLHPGVWGLAAGLLALGLGSWRSSATRAGS